MDTEICRCAMDGLLALPRVGLAVAGALLGSYDGLSVTVLNSFEIPCSHASGPSFTLTPEEKKQAHDLIRHAGLPVVGWYFSKPRGEMTLSVAEMALFHEFCPEPWQIAIIIQPSTVKPTRTLFLCRDALGTLTGHPEVNLIAGEAPPVINPLPAEVAPLEVNDALAAPLADSALVGVEPAEIPARPLARGVLWTLIAAALSLTAVFVFIALYPWGAVTPLLALDLVDVNGDLLIRWDRNSVIGAGPGLLSVKDGVDLSYFRLDASQLESGVFHYARKSRAIDATLSIGDSGARATFFDVTPPSNEPSR